MKAKVQRKVKELYDRMRLVGQDNANAKFYVLEAIDLVLFLPVSFMKEQEDIEAYGIESTYEFWEEVKIEAEKFEL